MYSKEDISSKLENGIDITDTSGAKLNRITEEKIKPANKQQSPILFIRKAFLAANCAEFFLYQNPINK